MDDQPCWKEAYKKWAVHEGGVLPCQEEASEEAAQKQYPTFQEEASEKKVVPVH